MDPGRRGLSTAPRGLEVPPASSRVTSTVRPRHHRGPQPGSARAAHSGGWRDSGVFRPSAPSAACSGRRAERVHVAVGQAHVGGGCREVWAGLRPTPHTRRRPPSPTTGRRPRALSVPPDPAERAPPAARALWLEAGGGVRDRRPSLRPGPGTQSATTPIGKPRMAPPAARSRRLLGRNPGPGAGEQLGGRGRPAQASAAGPPFPLLRGVRGPARARLAQGLLLAGRGRDPPPGERGAQGRRVRVSGSEGTPTRQPRLPGPSTGEPRPSKTVRTLRGLGASADSRAARPPRAAPRTP